MYKVMNVYSRNDDDIFGTILLTRNRLLGLLHMYEVIIMINVKNSNNGITAIYKTFKYKNAIRLINYFVEYYNFKEEVVR